MIGRSGEKSRGVAKRCLMLAVMLAVTVVGMGQQLKAGFDIEEYLECLRVSSHMDSLRVEAKYLSSEPRHSRQVYTAGEVGFDNSWELWQDTKSGAALIMMRATVSTMSSWGANFNAGMVSARGVIDIGRKVRYDYCEDSTAHVHGGWTAGMAYMQDDILQKVDSLVKAGVRDFIVSGHSQGGALSQLTTAMLRRCQATGRLPKDLRIKTYSSAAPKTGDYLFAMHYENMTGDWAFTVVNPDDWVPETPLSVQRTSDFRPTNPFAQIDDLLSSTSGGTRLKLKFVYKKISKPGNKEVENLTKYLGKTVGGMLADGKKGYVAPEYQNVANYSRVGRAIILMPGQDYYKVHPRASKDVFEHHQYVSYEMLAERYGK